MSTQTVDLNADLGEGFGPWEMTDDEGLLEVISSANVACGQHAGDPAIMARVFSSAKARGVMIGAHPGFADLIGFGRRRLPLSLAEIEHLVAYQVGAAIGMASLVGAKVTYVKAHGALGNWASEDLGVAEAVMRAIKAVGPGLWVLAIAGTQSERAAEGSGLGFAREVFADRAYTDQGLLVPRSEPGAVIYDEKKIIARVLAMVQNGEVISQSGKALALKPESICLHGDTPGAVNLARKLRAALEASGVAIRSFVPSP